MEYTKGEKIKEVGLLTGYPINVPDHEHKIVVWDDKKLRNKILKFLNGDCYIKCGVLDEETTENMKTECDMQLEIDKHLKVIEEYREENKILQRSNELSRRVIEEQVKKIEQLEVELVRDKFSPFGGIK
jgi:hypothetical protein